MKKLLLLSGLALLIAFPGCRNSQPATEVPAQQAEAEPVDIPDPELVKQTRPVRLYFADPDRYGLSVETRKVFELPDQTAMLKQVLSTLERGPLGNLKPTFPACLTVSNVFTVEDTIFVDLRKEPDSAQIGGVEGEALFIHSVANTALAVYPKQFYRLRFLVNGVEADTLLGHFDGRRTYTYNRSIILR